MIVTSELPPVHSGSIHIYPPRSVRVSCWPCPRISGRTALCTPSLTLKWRGKRTRRYRDTRLPWGAALDPDYVTTGSEVERTACLCWAARTMILASTTPHHYPRATATAWLLWEGFPSESSYNSSIALLSRLLRLNCCYLVLVRTLLICAFVCSSLLCHSLNSISTLSPS